MDRNEFLETHTNKDAADIKRRVFYTLSEGVKPSAIPSERQAWRNSKLLSLLVEHLQQRGVISDDEIDALLLETVR